MNRSLALFLLLVAAVVGLGFYLDWFGLSTRNEGQKSNITITVDKEKIREDEEKAKEKLKEVGQKVKQKTSATSQKSNGENH